MAITIQIRRDTSANWIAVDPILAQGEFGFETNTGRGKYGNGVDIWTALPYFSEKNQNTSSINLSVDSLGLKADLNTTLKSNYDDAYSKRVDTWNVPLSFSGNAVSLLYDSATLGVNGSNQLYAITNPADRLVSTNSTLILSDDATDQILTGNLGKLKIRGNTGFAIGNEPTGTYPAFTILDNFINADTPASAGKAGIGIGVSNANPTVGVVLYTAGTSTGSWFAGTPVFGVRIGTAVDLYDNTGALMLLYHSDTGGNIGDGTRVAFGVNSNDVTNVASVVYAQVGAMTTGAIFASVNNATVMAFYASDSTMVCTNVNADLLDGQHGSYYATASGYIPYNGATADVDLGIYDITATEATFKGATTFGNGTNDVVLNFNAANDASLTWISNDRVLSLKKGTDSVFYYPSYEPILAVNATGDTLNLNVAVALQLYVNAGTVDAGELYAFWGGIYDTGSSAKGCVGDAAGLFAYNAFQATNARTYAAVYGIIGISETSGASNLVITDLAGGSFKANDGGDGTNTFTRTYGIWIKDAGKGGVTNYGLYIDSITAGTTDYAIYCAGGTLYNTGLLDNRGNAVFNENGTATVDFRIESDTEPNMFFLDANANTNGIIYLGGTTDGITIDKGGDQKFIGSAGFYPRLLNQAAEPTAGTGATQLDTGELCIWTDSDDAKCYLAFNQSGTIKTIELT